MVERLEGADSDFYLKLAKFILAVNVNAALLYLSETKDIGVKQISTMIIRGGPPSTQEVEQTNDFSF